MHIGSGTDLEHLSQVCGAMERLARGIAPSLGHHPAPAAACRPVPADRRPGRHRTPTSASGTRHASGSRRRPDTRSAWRSSRARYLVAESGFLLAEVRAVKRMGGKHLLSGRTPGFNNLARPILYGSYHPMSVAPADGATDRPRRAVAVGGPLCESGDIFHPGRGGSRLHSRVARGGRSVTF